MRNAKQEYLEEIEGKVVVCAEISCYGVVGRQTLKIGCTEYARKKFEASLDYNYNSGYGTQNLYGYIWYDDGSWSEREEYDGAEGWTHKSVPVVPEYLKGETK